MCKLGDDYGPEESYGRRNESSESEKDVNESDRI